MRGLSSILWFSAALVSCSDTSTSQIEPDLASKSAADTEISAGKNIEETADTFVYSSERNAYFGDLHVHTMYSFDAFIFGTRTTPNDAYRFAKGGTLIHPAGFPMKLDIPLDFYAVSDHGGFLGLVRKMADSTTDISKLAGNLGLTRLFPDGTGLGFSELYEFLRSDRASELKDESITKDTWEDIQAAAEFHNEPGRFTTFVAYEYTSSESDNGNLHRNVIFRDANVPDMPFTRIDSTNPEDLWAWMDNNRENGIESLAIPHNSNGSNGHMFSLNDFSGGALDSAYADQRMRNEPLVEIAQVKGASDTHPMLSPNDEWADFEIMSVRVAGGGYSEPSGSYIREAYLNGLKLDAEQGFNPFRFGVIGSSDTHNSSHSGDEDNYWGKTGFGDGLSVNRGSVPLANDETGEAEYIRNLSTWGAAGLAGVWAEENTRSSIYDAFRRKETFGTSGTRMKVRFFAGYDMPAPAESGAISRAYENGVPMGGDLLAETNRQPEFFVWVAKDPNAAPLDRIQIIKGWVEDGEIFEQVYDVACSSGFPDGVTYRCPDNGAKVNLEDCSISTDVGAAELRTFWEDPDFNADQRAFYYVRGLENPTCRWSTWDAVHAGVPPREGSALTIQERIWSSPIWITPTD